MCSPRKKKVEYDKQEDDSAINSSKRPKSNCLEAPIAGMAFDQESSLESLKAYQDAVTRFQILYLPDLCKNNTCNHKNDANIKQINTTAEKCFNVQMSNNSWHEALEVCLVCITPHQYMSPNVLKDIVEIIMNAHDDSNSEWTIDYILKKCQYTLLLHFNTHPPCIARSIRDCYKQFLISPMNQKLHTLTNREKYLCKEGIIAYCVERLLYEISIESRDEMIIDRPDVPENVEDGVKKLHWRKANLELFEFLVRTERINRLMLVMECIVHLLQTDLALSHIRHTLSTIRADKKLIAHILWPNAGLKHGIVSEICRKIIEVFVYFVHLQYPEGHIKTMTSWINVVSNMFHMSESNQSEFPSAAKNCRELAKHFYNTIISLPTASVKRILERLPPFMQYLIGERYVSESRPELYERNIMYITEWFIEHSPWGNCNGEKSITELSRPCMSTNLKLYELFKDLEEKCKMYQPAIKNKSASDSNNISVNPYPKLDLEKCDKKIVKEYFNIYCITLIGYFESHNLRNIKKTLESPNKCDASLNTYTASFKIKILDFYNTLLEDLRNKNDVNSRKLLKIINNYWCDT